MGCRHIYRMTANGMLVCEKCGAIKSRHRRRGGQRRTGRGRRHRRRGAGRRAAVIAACVAVAIVLGMLAMQGGLGALEEAVPWNLRPDPAPGGQPPPPGSPESEPGGAGAPVPPPGSPEWDLPIPSPVLDTLSDIVRPAPPPAAWNVSVLPGSYEAQLVEFRGRGATPDVLKQVLVLDAPTQLLFSFDNHTRVHRHILLDEWHAGRGLAEIGMGGAAPGPAGPPPLVDGVSRIQPPDGKIKHVRADAPPLDSDAVESLAVDAYRDPVSRDGLYEAALDAINAHREAAGVAPVRLSGNIAAQMHAQDVLERLLISHYMSNGEKPYMTYSMAGGAGYVAQNVAFAGYDRPAQCGGYVLCERIDPAADMLDQHNGMMFDDAHADWGHRDNILDPYHTHVSIGVAYTDYTLAFVQNFETRRIEDAGPDGRPANPVSLDGSGRIRVDGTMDAGLGVHSIAVHYDPLPTTAAYRLYADDMSYTLGEPVAYIFEPHPRGYASAGDTVLMADRWEVSGGRVLVEFDAPAAMASSGAYTFIVWLEEAGSAPFVGSARTFMVGDPVRPAGTG